MNNIGPSHFTVAPLWPKSYHTTGPKGTFLRHLVRHRTLSKTLTYVCSYSYVSGYVCSLQCCYLQTMEQDQLILAAKEGDVVTIEELLNDKYVDVNTVESHDEIVWGMIRRIPVCS